MTQSRRALLAAALLALSLVPATSAGHQATGSTSGTAPWWETTALDADGDGIDDDLERQLEETPADEAVSLVASYADEPTPAQRDALEDRGARIVYVVDVVPAVVAEAPAERVRDLADAPGVVLVEKDRHVEPLLDDSRPLVGGDAVGSGMGYTGKGIGIAVFDTGIDTDHPDLGDKLEATYDATRDESAVGGLLGDARDPVDPGDTDGHGTHVAGAAAGTGQDSGYEYVGLAPDADLVAVKIFDDQGRARSSYILKGIDWVLDNRDRFDLRIMQMSIGGDPTDGKDSVSRAIGVSAGEGVLSVVAAGNRGPNEETVTFPGVAPAALTVGATNDDKKVAEFSSRGPTVAGDRKPDMVAPGVEIVSTLPPEVNGGDNYGSLSGTSMAAPHVAGAAAALWEANASLTPTLVKFILVASSEPVGTPEGTWNPSLGWGFLDAETAANAAVSPETLGQPPYEEKAGNLDFGRDASRLDRFIFETDQTRRSLLPAPGFAVLAGAVLAAALLRGRGPS